MSANVPTDICFSFKGLRERGGKTGPHKDGWGVAFYQGKGVSTFKDANPSYQSEIARLISDYPDKKYGCGGAYPTSQQRRSRAGRIPHPFTRTLWGRYWTYAHNGQLTGRRNLAGRTTLCGRSDRQRACILLSTQYS